VVDKGGKMDRLLRMLKDTKGGFATLESIIEKRSLKKSRITGIPFEETFSGPVTSHKIEYVNIKVDYQAAVNRQRVREDVVDPDFVAGELPWGEWELYGLVIVHKGERYLRYFEDMNRNWERSERMWLCGDRPMSEQEIVMWKGSFGPVEREDSGRQEVDKAIRPRTVKFCNIVKLRFDSKEYVA
jgi:hypothetical protein